MDPINHLRRYRRRPAHERVRADPSTYLTTARLHLLRTLPPTHRLYTRATTTGQLKPSSHLLPDIPRVPFTESELEEIRIRRRFTTDPDDVRYQLQDSKLVQMWNADYEREEQWQEYDEARPTMEMKKEMAGLPEQMFDADEVVWEKRRRVVSEENSTPVRRVVFDDTVVEEMELEEGELEEEARYIGDVDEVEDEEIEAESLRTLKEVNEKLRATNKAMRVMAGNTEKDIYRLPSPSSASPESSGNESEESRKTICEFKTKNSDEDDDGTSDVAALAQVDAWDEEMHNSTEELERTRPIQERSKDTQLGHELG